MEVGRKQLSEHIVCHIHAVVTHTVYPPSIYLKSVFVSVPSIYNKIPSDYSKEN